MSATTDAIINCILTGSRFKVLVHAEASVGMQDLNLESGILNLESSSMRDGAPASGLTSPAGPSRPLPGEEDRRQKTEDRRQTLNLTAPEGRSVLCDLTSDPCPHFPEIIVDPAGFIILCPGCSGSDASKDGDYFICRSCGSVWRGR